MNMLIPIVSVFGLLLLTFAIVLWRMNRAQAALQQQIRELSDRVSAQGRDLAGLSVAGANAGRMLLELDQRLNQPAPNASPHIVEDDSSRFYSTAVDRINRGATPEELAAELGVSLSEARLMARLYASDN